MLEKVKFKRRKKYNYQHLSIYRESKQFPLPDNTSGKLDAKGIKYKPRVVGIF